MAGKRERGKLIKENSLIRQKVADLFLMQLDHLYQVMQEGYDCDAQTMRLIFDMAKHCDIGVDSLEVLHDVSTANLAGDLEGITFPDMED